MKKRFHELTIGSMRRDEFTLNELLLKMNYTCTAATWTRENHFTPSPEFEKNSCMTKRLQE